MTQTVHYIWWPLQAGAAITLPLFGRTWILHRRRTVPDWLREHELVHAAQIERMGGRAYLRAHFRQRNALYGYARVWSTEWWLGRETKLEKEAYAIRAAEGR